jgi:hypothetical protein
MRHWAQSGARKCGTTFGPDVRMATMGSTEEQMPAKAKSSRALKRLRKFPRNAKAVSALFGRDLPRGRESESDQC